MQKTYFHNGKHIIEGKVRKKTISLEYIDQKRIVDINNLLNRVRMNEKNETKRKIIFYISTLLGLSLIGTLIMLLK